MEKQILNPPFFLFEGASLDIFTDLAALETQIEPQDWQDNVYRVFDAEGRRLIFQIKTESKRVWLSIAEIEHIRFKETEPPDDDVFLGHLKQSYQACFSENGDGLDNKELMQRLIAKLGTISSKA